MKAPLPPLFDPVCLDFGIIHPAAAEIVYTAIHECEMVFGSLERGLIIRQSLQC